MLFLLTFWGCNTNQENTIQSPGPPNEIGVTLSTDSLVYHFTGDRLIIPVTINNNTQNTVYYGTCGEIPLFATKKLDNNNWSTSTFWGMPCLTIYYMGMIDIPAYSSIHDSLYVTEPGVYKFLLLYGWSKENSISDTLVSNQFAVIE